MSDTSAPVTPTPPVVTDSSQSSPSRVAHKINLVAIPIALATAVMAIEDVDSPIRVWTTVLLVLFGPGSGLTQFLRIPDKALQLGVVIALSLTIDILVGQGLLSAHNLSASAAACILAGFTCIRPLRRRPSPSESNEPSEQVALSDTVDLAGSADPAEGEKR